MGIRKLHNCVTQDLIPKSIDDAADAVESLLPGVTLPRSVNQAFDFAELIVPGVKKMKAPLFKTAANLWPYLKKLPEVLAAMAPTLMEIASEIAGGKEPTDEDFIKWGGAAMETGGEYFADLVKALKASPIKQLVKQFKALNLKTLLKKAGLKSALKYLDWIIKMMEGVERFAEN